MKLSFEDWIEKTNFSTTAKPLFIESVICYKSGAYRASLLLSYLGFLTSLKERILSATRPNLFPDGEWTNLTQKLQHEDTWESVVFDATQQQEKLDNNKVKIKDAVFSITESLRQQIKYWKDRRNDCAHNKDNKIIDSHVETFWAFLESNYLKITIEGGMQSLIFKLKRHYDLTYTPKGKDITPLVLEIEHSIQTTELSSFWHEAFSSIDSNYEYWIDEGINDFSDKIMAFSSEPVRNSFFQFVKKDVKTMHSFIQSKPKIILLLGLNPQEVRNYWNTKLSESVNSLNIYACLLRNNLIPENEIPEANTLLFNGARYYVDSDDDHRVLAANGFGETIYNHAFVEKRKWTYLWANNRQNLLCDFVEKYPLTKEVVGRICTEFSGSLYSYWLKSSLNNMFTENQAKRAEFIQIATENRLNIPNRLNSLLDD